MLLLLVLFLFVLLLLVLLLFVFLLLFVLFMLVFCCFVFFVVFLCVFHVVVSGMWVVFRFGGLNSCDATGAKLHRLLWFPWVRQLRGEGGSATWATADFPK